MERLPRHLPGNLVPKKNENRNYRDIKLIEATNRYLCSSYLNKVAAAHGAEDLVDGRVTGEGAVEDAEVSFEAFWDVVATTSRVDHRSHQLDVDDVREFSWFLQIVEATLFDHLSRDLIGHLSAKQ